MAKISPKLPLALSSEGGYGSTRTIGEAVQQNLKNLVLTVPGERVMDPDFGVGLYKYLFLNSTPAVHESLKSKIVTQTAKYLPFVNLQLIEIGGPDDDHFTTTSNLMSIKIVYSVESIDEVNILTLSTDPSTN